MCVCVWVGGVCLCVYVCLCVGMCTWVHRRIKEDAFQATSATWHQAGYTKEMSMDVLASWNWHFSLGYYPDPTGNEVHASTETGSSLAHTSRDQLQLPVT